MELGPLSAFFTARLDELEATATAAAKYPGQDWTTLAGRDNSEATVFEDGGNPIAWIDDGDAMAVATHMASHDPRHVLREIEADRELLRRYMDMARNADERRTEGHPSPAVENMRDAFYVAVLIRVAVHSDHPDYRQEWKP